MKRLRSMPPILWAAMVFVGGVILIVLASILFPAPQQPASPAPSPDSFYTPTGELPTVAGQLISAQPLTERPGGAGLSSNQVGWRILYSTTSVSGEIDVASGTVVVDKEHLASELPVLTIAHGTTGVASQCAPSLAPQPLAGGAMSATETLIDQGWAAITTDYVGLGTQGPHPYMVGPSEGNAVLDAALAAQHIDELTLSKDTVIWGFSQGGHGALWAGGLAPTYSPELNILGVVAMAPATNTVTQFSTGQQHPISKMTSSYIAHSWPQVFPDLGLKELINPDSVKIIDQLSQFCFDGEDLNNGANLAAEHTEPIFLESAYAPDSRFMKELEANRVSPQTSGIINVPVLVAQGETDFLILPENQQEWVNQACAVGQDLEYRTYPDRDHTSLLEPDSRFTPELVQWTKDRQAGLPAASTC